MTTYNVVKEPFSDKPPQTIGMYVWFSDAMQAASGAWWAMSVKERIWNKIRVEWYDGLRDITVGIEYPPKDPVLRNNVMYMPTRNFDTIIAKWDDVSMEIAGSIEEWASIYDGADPVADEWGDGKGNAVSHKSAIALREAGE